MDLVHILLDLYVFLEGSIRNGIVFLILSSTC